MINLSGRVAFITGASRGIGKAIALKFAEAGGAVVACAREEHALTVAQEITASGGIAEAVTLEVTDADSVSRAIQTAVARFERVDVLVYNDGVCL